MHGIRNADLKPLVVSYLDNDQQLFKQKKASYYEMDTLSWLKQLSLLEDLQVCCSNCFVLFPRQTQPLKLQKSNQFPGKLLKSNQSITSYMLIKY